MEYITIILSVLTFLATATIGLVVWAFKINNGIDKKVAKGIAAYDLVQKDLRDERSKRYDSDIEELFEEKEKFIVKDMQFDDRFRKIELQINTLETKIGGK